MPSYQVTVNSGGAHYNIRNHREVVVASAPEVAVSRVLRGLRQRQERPLRVPRGAWVNTSVSRIT